MKIINKHVPEAVINQIQLPEFSVNIPINYKKM